MSLLNQNDAQYVVTAHQRIPREGPKCMPIQLLFSVAVQYDLDLTNIQQLNFMSMIQGIFIDNRANGSSITIFIPTSRQRITIEAAQQAYMPLLCPNPAKISFISSGAIDDVFVILMNTPVAPAVWNATP